MDPSVLAGIGDAKLKKAETVDKSAPVIEEGVKVKESERPQLLAEISKGTDLKKAETSDKSAPVIEQGVKVKESERPQLLAEIQNKAK
ncbi:Actobindin [Entamoeba marina]